MFNIFNDINRCISFVWIVSLLVCLIPSQSSEARPFGSRVSQHVSNAIKQQVRKAIIPTLKTKRHKIEFPRMMFFSKNKRYLVLSMKGGYISTWDMEKGEEIDRFRLGDIRATDLAVDEQRKNLYVIDQDGKVYFKPMVRGGFSGGVKDGALKAVSLSSTGQGKDLDYNKVKISRNYLVLTTDKEVFLFDRQTKNLLASNTVDSKITALDITDDANDIALATNNKSLSVFQYDPIKKTLSLKKSWDTKYVVKSIQISRTGSAIAVHYKNNYYSFIKPQIHSDLKHNTRKKALSLNVENEQIHGVTEAGEIFSQDIDTVQIQTRQKIDHDSDLGLLFHKGKFLLIPEPKKGIKMFDVQTGEKIAQLLSTKASWAIVDKFGRYDGDEEAFHDVSWDADGDLLELDKFAEKYFEPGLLTKIVHQRHQMITQPKAAIEKGLYLPPKLTIKILSDEENYELPNTIELSITAKVEDKYETLQDLTFYHNGKTVPASKVRFIEGTQEGKTGVKKWEISIKPIIGNNKFLVEVQGWEGVIGHSNEAFFRVTSDAKPKMRAFVKSIGINDYQDPELRLDFAVSDAKAMFKLFSNSPLVGNGGNNQKQDGRVRTLVLNYGARKSEILKLLERTRQNSKENDLLVVFMAGHGLVVKNEWYFLPQEASSKQDMSRVADVWLSAKELMDKFVEIPSQRIVLIIDACQSGAVTADFNNFHQRRALRGLSRQSGIHILAATRADQFAPEFVELGHGLFSYTILRGMDRDKEGYLVADQWPQDGQLMVSELQKYVIESVPALAHNLAPKYFRAGNDSKNGSIDDRVMVTPVGTSQGQDFVIFK